MVEYWGPPPMRRRTFLKASSVAAGLSVLQGCSEADQEHFLAQPARRPGLNAGESVWRPSVCRQCDAGCGTLVRVVDGDAKKVEGNPAHPVNRGGVCALGHSSLQELYNPDRILTPLVGGEPATWEDALGAVVEAIQGAEGGRVAFATGDRGGLVGELTRRLAVSLGAPEPAYVGPPEHRVEREAVALLFGWADFPHFDLVGADYVLTIGAPILDRWRSPVSFTGQVAAMRRDDFGPKGHLTVAESRMSLTGANADTWLPVRPGTEGVFARALGGLLLETDGPLERMRPEYRRHFAEEAPTPQEAAEECDVAEDKIRQVAHELSIASSPVVIAGGSAASHTNGAFNVTAGLALNLLLGSVGPGRPMSASAPPLLARTPRFYPNTDDVATRLRDRAVDVLITVDVDLVHQSTAGSGVSDALEGVGTVVALSSFRDDTTARADVVLPLKNDLERFNAYEPPTVAAGQVVVGVSQPVVEPIAEVHHPGDVLLAMAAAIGGRSAEELPWESFEALARERVEFLLETYVTSTDGDDITWFDALEAGGVFASGGLEPSLGGSGLGVLAPGPARTDGDPTRYPFTLVPYESIRMGDGRGANRPWLQEMPDPLTTVMWNSWIELSPSDAETIGAVDGDLLRVESPYGTAEVHAVVDVAARPGVVAMPLGHGHSDYGRYAQDRGANPLHLLGSLAVARIGVEARSATRVSLTVIGPGSLVRFGAGYGYHLETDRHDGVVAPAGGHE